MPLPSISSRLSNAEIGQLSSGWDSGLNTDEDASDGVVFWALTGFSASGLGSVSGSMSPRNDDSGRFSSSVPGG